MKYVLKNANILDGTLNMEAYKANILVEDGIIKEISNNTYEGVKSYNLEGKYLMPGMINLHVHLPGSGMPKDTGKQKKETVDKLLRNPITRKIVFKLCAKYAKIELMSGVTTIRTVGGLENIDSAIRDRINFGKLIGPRILASNKAISVPGGHMAGLLAYEALSVEDAKRLVNVVAETKPDLIKLMITGGVLDATKKGEPGVLKMPAEYVRAACDEAHKLGFVVAAHVESPEGVKVALENGVDTIEHGALPTKEMLELFKKNNVSDICTISPAVPLSKFDMSVSGATELTQYNGNIVFEGIVSCAKECYKNGVTVGIGTDTACPYVTHYDFWREVVYFNKLVGVSAKEALYTATLGNAKIARIADKCGSIEVGKEADILVINSNPLDNLETLRNPFMVVTRGKLINKPKNKKFAYVEKNLDEYLASL